MKEKARKTKFSKSLDIDKIKINRDHYFPDAYVIDLPLDSTPDHAWQDIFEREWKSSRYIWDRKLFVVGDKLRLIATINDMDEKLGWVKRIIEQTNKDIEEYNRETAAEKDQGTQQIKKQIRVEESRIELIRETLRKSLA